MFKEELNPNNNMEDSVEVNVDYADLDHNVSEEIFL